MRRSRVRAHAARTEKRAGKGAASYEEDDASIASTTTTMLADMELADDALDAFAAALDDLFESR